MQLKVVLLLSLLAFQSESFRLKANKLAEFKAGSKARTANEEMLPLDHQMMKLAFEEPQISNAVGDIGDDHNTNTLEAVSNPEDGLIQGPRYQYLDADRFDAFDGDAMDTALALDKVFAGDASSKDSDDDSDDEDDGEGWYDIYSSDREIDWQERLKLDSERLNKIAARRVNHIKEVDCIGTTQGIYFKNTEGGGKAAETIVCCPKACGDTCGGDPEDGCANKLDREPSVFRRLILRDYRKLGDSANKCCGKEIARRVNPSSCDSKWCKDTWSTLQGFGLWARPYALARPMVDENGQPMLHPDKDGKPGKPIQVGYYQANGPSKSVEEYRTYMFNKYLMKLEQHVGPNYCPANTTPGTFKDDNKAHKLICCAKECGVCGGEFEEGSENRKASARNCCGKAIVQAGVICNSERYHSWWSASTSACVRGEPLVGEDGNAVECKEGEPCQLYIGTGGYPHKLNGYPLRPDGKLTVVGPYGRPMPAPVDILCKHAAPHLAEKCQQYQDDHPEKDVRMSMRHLREERAIATLERDMRARKLAKAEAEDSGYSTPSEWTYEEIAPHPM